MPGQRRAKDTGCRWPFNNFVQNFNSLLAKIGKENKLSYLLGDFNLNLMNYHSHSLKGEFVDVTYANLFVPLIVRPTLITSYSASLIDNIFANSFSNDIVSGLFFTDVSDHLPIFAIQNEQGINNYGEKSFLSFRNKNSANITKCHELYGQLTGQISTTLPMQIQLIPVFSMSILRFLTLVSP